MFTYIFDLFLNFLDATFFNFFLGEEVLNNSQLLEKNQIQNQIEIDNVKEKKPSQQLKSSKETPETSISPISIDTIKITIQTLVITEKSLDTLIQSFNEFKLILSNLDYRFVLKELQELEEKALKHKEAFSKGIGDRDMRKLESAFREQFSIVFEKTKIINSIARKWFENFKTFIIKDSSGCSGWVDENNPQLLSFESKTEAYKQILKEYGFKTDIHFLEKASEEEAFISTEKGKPEVVFPVSKLLVFVRCHLSYYCGLFGPRSNTTGFVQDTYSLVNGGKEEIKGIITHLQSKKELLEKELVEKKLLKEKELLEKKLLEDKESKNKEELIEKKNQRRKKAAGICTVFLVGTGIFLYHNPNFIQQSVSLTYSERVSSESVMEGTKLLIEYFK
jgi:hypothetical protein